jgi:uncharacterized protein (DUF427 family)
MQSNVIQERVPLQTDPGHWVHVSECPRHVRAFLNGQAIADSKRALLVRESDVLPVYYFPRADVRTDLLRSGERRTRCPYKGEAAYWTIETGGKAAEDAAWSYAHPLPAAAAIAGHFAFAWSQMDRWMEEEEEIFVHPRDPYKRVDVLASTRHVRVVIAGETVAESRHPRLLFETNHPVRYYLPREDVRLDLLVPSPTRTRCPYKGPASYWSVKLGERLFADMVWSYVEPIPECPKIRELLCFFHERGAEIFVDGERVPPPRTKWARPLEPA